MQEQLKSDGILQIHLMQKVVCTYGVSYFLVHCDLPIYATVTFKGNV